MIELKDGVEGLEDYPRRTIHTEIAKCVGKEAGTCPVCHPEC